jgi:hypothetical protein
MEANQRLARTMKKGMSRLYVKILQLAEQIVIRGKPYRTSMTNILGFWRLLCQAAFLLRVDGRVEDME